MVKLKTCPPTGRFQLPDTGQTQCYNQEGEEISPAYNDELFGQNGNFIIHPINFTKLNEDNKEISDDSFYREGLRMVRDENTGLIWEVKSPNPASINYFNDTYTFQEAQDIYVRKLNTHKYGGFNDWRIPNKDELRSIIDYSKTNPAIDTWYFPNCQIGIYLTSVTYEMQPYFAWGIFFGLGSGVAVSKTSKRFVLAVRGGYNELFGKSDLSRFADNEDGTITDKATDLMWQKGENKRMNFWDAMKEVKNMRLAGYSDWRLPNIKELNTILNLSYNKDKCWFFKEFFPCENAQSESLLHYLSSTSFEKTYLWVTNFTFGYDGYYANKIMPLLFRAVRNITPVKQTQIFFKLPDTGQNKCYDDEGNIISVRQLTKGERFFGQDGCFYFNPQSFDKLREGGKEISASSEQGFCMVKDKNTGLIWEVKSPNPMDINFMNNRCDWTDANKYIERLNKYNYGGFSDWRLPNREELRTIVCYNDIIPAINTKYFPTIKPDFYWSKDANAKDTKLIWGMYFAYGCAICYLKHSLFYVIAVRGGYNPAFGDITKYAFKDNNDGTITDLNTGLMWKKEESPELNFADALKYCETLDFAGYNDWRMPNMKEIATLVDLSFKDSCWFHRDFFPSVKTAPRGFYASSTTFAQTFGWGANFQFGFDGYYADKKYGIYPFRPVRNVNSKR